MQTINEEDAQVTKKSMATAWIVSFVLAASLSGTAAAKMGRDYIYIVGSSTVYPFSTVVAERFGRSTKFKTPKVEATGSGGGFKLFCAGVGVKHPDITNASRAIKQSEIDDCASNGVTGIIEVRIGYDGIVVANSLEEAAMRLTSKQIFLALAKAVPAGDEGELIPNPYRTWRDVDSSLPDIKIEVLGPPPTSGTRDAFVELAMEGGCKTFPWIKQLKSKDENRYKSICHAIREDGGYVEAGENDNLIVQKLRANPSALGRFGYSFLDQNTDTLQGSFIDGAEPTFETIADRSYSVSRPLFFYVKKAHVGVIPGLQEFLKEFTSERASGDEGYLSDRGLVPMSVQDRRKIAASVELLSPQVVTSH